MHQLLTLEIGNTRISVDEELRLTCLGEFKINTAVSILLMAEELLCVYGDCVKRDQRTQVENGWLKYSNQHHETKLLRNYIQRDAAKVLHQLDRSVHAAP